MTDKEKLIERLQKIMASAGLFALADVELDAITQAWLEDVEAARAEGAKFVAELNPKRDYVIALPAGVEPDGFLDWKKLPSNIKFVVTDGAKLQELSDLMKNKI